MIPLGCVLRTRAAGHRRAGRQAGWDKGDRTETHNTHRRRRRLCVCGGGACGGGAELQQTRLQELRLVQGRGIHAQSLRRNHRRVLHNGAIATRATARWK